MYLLQLHREVIARIVVVPALFPQMCVPGLLSDLVLLRPIYQPPKSAFHLISTSSSDCMSPSDLTFYREILELIILFQLRSGLLRLQRLRVVFGVLGRGVFVLVEVGVALCCSGHGEGVCAGRDPNLFSMVCIGESGCLCVLRGLPKARSSSLTDAGCPSCLSSLPGAASRGSWRMYASGKPAAVLHCRHEIETRNISQIRKSS